MKKFPSFNPLKDAFKKAFERNPDFAERIRQEKKENLLKKIDQGKSFKDFFDCLREAEKEKFIRRATPQEVKDINKRFQELKEKFQKAQTKEERVKVQQAFFSLSRRTLKAEVGKGKNRKKIIFVEKNFVSPYLVKEKDQKGEIKKEEGIRILVKLAKMRERLIKEAKEREEIIEILKASNTDIETFLKEKAPGLKIGVEKTLIEQKDGKKIPYQGAFLLERIKDNKIVAKKAVGSWRAVLPKNKIFSSEENLPKPVKDILFLLMKEKKEKNKKLG